MLCSHRILDHRVGGLPLIHYKVPKEPCGKVNCKNVVLITPIWDEVTEEVSSADKPDLVHADSWRAMIALSSTTHRFEGTTEPTWKFIDSLSVPPLASSRCPLQIQLEMVDGHLPLHRTATGRTVLDSLNDVMSGVKEVFRRFSRGKKRLSSPTTQHHKNSLRKSFSLRSSGSTSTSSDSSAVGQSVWTGIISINSSGTCSVEGYQSVQAQVIMHIYFAGLR
ncbi:hypothetical protein EDD16DRAFT_1488596 [Pisolithus croceorrhizus]|nr:hypothetical protein EDD16DRAFT_1488596 [Pisolithus croceorrhizus]KAI6111704.1 hypothetical protein EV401DRAFT_1868231 [Pisolithus croceorrhizus]